MRRSAGIVALLGICAVLPAARAEEVPTLLIAYGNWFAAPYAIFDQGQLVGGIIQDLAQELSVRFARPVRLVNVPRKRLDDALRRGEANVSCLTSPSWLAAPQDFLWSRPLVRERDVFVTRPERHLVIENYSDLRHLSVGTVFGYSYSAELEGMFRANLAIREDSSNVISNLRRVEDGWIDTAIIAETPLRYALRKSTDLGPLRVSTFADAEHDYACAFDPRTGVTQAQIDALFAGLVQDGTIAKILKAHL